jgi:hypothetical protein
MRPPRSLVTAAALTVLAAAPVSGQTTSPTATPQPQQTESERSPLGAALLQAAFPPLPIGYLYAGNVWRGLIPTAVMVGGATLFFVEAVEIFDWNDPEASDELILLGLAATVGGYVFGIVDAANVAKNRNARIRAGGAALRVVPAPSGVGVALAIPLG